MIFFIMNTSCLFKRLGVTKHRVLEERYLLFVQNVIIKFGMDGMHNSIRLTDTFAFYARIATKS